MLSTSRAYTSVLGIVFIGLCCDLIVSKERLVVVDLTVRCIAKWRDITARKQSSWFFRFYALCKQEMPHRKNS